MMASLHTVRSFLRQQCLALQNCTKGSQLKWLLNLLWNVESTSEDGDAKEHPVFRDGSELQSLFKKLASYSKQLHEDVINGLSSEYWLHLAYWECSEELLDLLLQVRECQWWADLPDDLRSRIDNILNNTPAPVALHALSGILGSVSLSSPHAKGATRRRTQVHAVGAETAAQLLCQRFTISGTNDTPRAEWSSSQQSTVVANGIRELVMYTAVLSSHGNTNFMQMQLQQQRQRHDRPGSPSECPTSSTSTTASGIPGFCNILPPEFTALCAADTNNASNANGTGTETSATERTECVQQLQDVRNLHAHTWRKYDHMVGKDSVAGLLVSLPDRAASFDLPQLSHHRFYTHVLQKLVHVAVEHQRQSTPSQPLNKNTLLQTSELSHGDPTEDSSGSGGSGPDWNHAVATSAAQLCLEIMARLCNRGHMDLVLEMLYQGSHDNHSSHGNHACIESPTGNECEQTWTEGGSLHTQQTAKKALCVALSRSLFRSCAGSTGKLIQTLLMISAKSLPSTSLGSSPGTASWGVKTAVGSSGNDTWQQQQLREAARHVLLLLGGRKAVHADPDLQYILTEQLLAHVTLSSASLQLLISVVVLICSSNSKDGDDIDRISRPSSFHTDIEQWKVMLDDSDSKMDASSLSHLQTAEAVTLDAGDLLSLQDVVATLATLWGDVMPLGGKHSTHNTAPQHAERHPNVGPEAQAATARAGASIQKQAYLSQVIVTLLSHMSKADIEMTPGLMSGLLAGVSHRLASPQPSVRRQAMRVGRAFSIILDPSSDLFQDQGSLDLLPDEIWPGCIIISPPMTTASTQSQHQQAASSNTNGRAKKAATGDNEGAGALNGSSTTARSKHRTSHGHSMRHAAGHGSSVQDGNVHTDDESDVDVDSDDDSSGDSDDDSFVELGDLQEDPAADEWNNADPKSLQLRAVAVALRKNDEVTIVMEALKKVELLIRAGPDELDACAPELTRALLHCRTPEWAQADPGTKPEELPEVQRSMALTAITACAAVPSGDMLLAEVLSPHLDTYQRLLILQSMAAAAQELCMPTVAPQLEYRPGTVPRLVYAHQQGQQGLTAGDGRGGSGAHGAALPATPHKYALPSAAQRAQQATQGGSMMSASSERKAPAGSMAAPGMRAVATRVWGKVALEKQSRPAGRVHRNSFADVAVRWTYGLLREVDKVKHGVDLLGRDTLVLSSVLHTLGVFAECAASTPASLPVCSAVMELLAAPQIHGHAEVTIRRAALLASGQVLSALPASRLAGAIAGSQPANASGSAVIVDRPQILDHSDSALVRRLEWMKTWFNAVQSDDSDDNCRAMAGACGQLHAALMAEATVQLLTLDQVGGVTAGSLTAGPLGIGKQSQILLPFRMQGSLDTVKTLERFINDDNMLLTDLEPELLDQIVQSLSKQDIIRLLATCKWFLQYITQHVDTTFRDWEDMNELGLRQLTKRVKILSNMGVTAKVSISREGLDIISRLLPDDDTKPSDSSKGSENSSFVVIGTRIRDINNKRDAKTLLDLKHLDRVFGTSSSLNWSNLTAIELWGLRLNRLLPSSLATGCPTLQSVTLSHITLCSMRVTQDLSKPASLSEPHPDLQDYIMSSEDISRLVSQSSWPQSLKRLRLRWLNCDWTEIMETYKSGGQGSLEISQDENVLKIWGALPVCYKQLALMWVAQQCASKGDAGMLVDGGDDRVVQLGDAAEDQSEDGSAASDDEGQEEGSGSEDSEPDITQLTAEELAEKEQVWREHIAAAQKREISALEAQSDFVKSQISDAREELDRLGLSVNYTGWAWWLTQPPSITPFPLSAAGLLNSVEDAKSFELVKQHRLLEQQDEALQAQIKSAQARHAKHAEAYETLKLYYLRHDLVRSNLDLRQRLFQQFSQQVAAQMAALPGLEELHVEALDEHVLSGVQQYLAQHGSRVKHLSSSGQVRIKPWTPNNPSTLKMLMTGVTGDTLDNLWPHMSSLTSITCKRPIDDPALKAMLALPNLHHVTMMTDLNADMSSAHCMWKSLTLIHDNEGKNGSILTQLGLLPLHSLQKPVTVQCNSSKMLVERHDEGSDSKAAYINRLSKSLANVSGRNLGVTWVKKGGMMNCKYVPADAWGIGFSGKDVGDALAELLGCGMTMEELAQQRSTPPPAISNQDVQICSLICRLLSSSVVEKVAVEFNFLTLPRLQIFLDHAITAWPCMRVLDLSPCRSVHDAIPSSLAGMLPAQICEVELTTAIEEVDVLSGLPQPVLEDMMYSTQRSLKFVIHGLMSGIPDAQECTRRANATARSMRRKLDKRNLSHVRVECVVQSGYEPWI